MVLQPFLQQQQQLIPTTTTISNIKLLILKKEEYDIWVMEMEHYLEYIDNDVWKVIQNGNLKKRISTGKDGVVRILPPVSPAKIHAVKKERKARTILLMVIPKEHLRRFHRMDDAKEIWEAIRTRFCGNANSKKMQKAILKQQFEAFTISSSEGRFSKTDNFKGVPHPLTGDYTPKPQEEIDDSLYVYGKKGPQKPKVSYSDDNSTEHSTYQSNDNEGSCGNTSEHSSKSESESIKVEPSCATHVKTPRQQMKNQGTSEVKGKNWNKMMERELGEGYSFIKKKCFVCGSLSHLIKDCDYYEKKMAREAEFKKQRVFNTGNRVAKPVWTNANRVNHVNQFVPRSVQLNAGIPNINSVRFNINTGRINVNSVRPRVNTGSSNVNTVRSRQPVPTRTSNNFSPKRPQTLAGYNWRNSRPNSNCNSRPTFIRTVNAKGSSTKNMEDRGIFDSGCSGHMTGNKDYLDDFEECKGGSVTFGGRKGYITGKGTSEITNSAGTPNTNASEEEDEVEELIIVPILVQHTAAKVGTSSATFKGMIACFEQIVDFLKRIHIRYALEHNPTIYVSVIKQFWQTVTVITLDNEEQELKATIDTHEYIISESSIRNKLKLADKNGITEFTNAEIFEGMANLGYPIDNTFTFWKKLFTPNWKFMPVESQPPPNASVPSTSQPITKPHPDQELETETELHGSSSDFVHTPPTQVETSSPELKSVSPKPMEHTYDQPQPSPIQQPASPEPQPTSPPKIDNLEKELKEHKQTTTVVIVKLVKKVKKLETRVKYGNLPTRKMVLSDSESEDVANSSKQGRNLGEEDVASQKSKTYTKGVKSGLKKKLDVGVSYGDRKIKSASEEIKSGFTNISSGDIREEEASLAEIARIQAQEAAEIERKAELQRLDALAAKRLNDEFEMSEQQRKRAAEVQQQAQYYTEED
ncbi:hypothetical protein Tco_0129128 [Tanacetum coccineum]